MSRPTLVLVATGERFPIEGSVTIGRAGADIALEDDLVSRRHAAVHTSPGGGLEIEDLGSRNGTKVNGTAVERRQPLQEADVVEIGEVKLRVEGLRAIQVTRETPVIQEATREAPAPASSGQEFEAAGAGRRRSSGPSAARQGSATLVAFGIILGTAGALVAYFADRGL